ncbi:hypothetical protein [Microbacterium sp. NPDC057650]|uniref:hypothetical protein n=1 Tax=unclassified Microbacterium TaxID=2609290 RepID=UPI00366F2369
MKLSFKTPLAVASIAALAVTGFGASAASAAAAPTTTAATATIAQTGAQDVAAVRAQFNEYLKTADLDPTTRAHYEEIGASDAAFAAAVQTELDAVRETLRDAGISEGMAGAIDPGDYQCSTSELTTWARAQLASVDPDAWYWYNNGLLGVSPSLFLQYWTLMKTPVDPHDAEFGVNGDKTNELSRTFRALESFWGINDSEVGLVPFDAKVFASTPEAAADRQFVYDGFGRVNGLIAILMQLSVESGIMRGLVDEGFPGGVDNPLFTLNAFALDPDRADDSTGMLAELGITRRVAMGVGLSSMWDDIGLGAVGDRAVLGHEYAHQVQYTHDLFETDLTDEAEQTRRSELMADAFSTYFTVSKRGASLNKASALQAMQSFYTVGDCSFTNPGHHGTPNQRYASSEWAADFVKAQDDQGHIIATEDLAAEWEKVFPELIAPDAE